MPSFPQLRAAVLAVSATLALSTAALAQVGRSDVPTLKGRNLDATRERATQNPRSEGDQALSDGWPLYRTERGQSAFNDAMATLKATDGVAPAAEAFRNCPRLECVLSLPAATADGWLPPGRIWVSPQEYVLVVQSPRSRNGSYRRRSIMNMQYFVFHEFHNSSRNTDTFDTISSHSGGVFVPFYMSKPATDVRGRNFVMVVQVAPHDVVSVHASNRGSAGPGVEVARNSSDAIEPLQNLAGILLATMVKTAVPRVQVVNHHGSEGRPMLDAYDARLAALRTRPNAAAVKLPFVPAELQRVAAATGRLEELIQRRGLTPRIPVAERTFFPEKTATLAPTPAALRPGIDLRLIEQPRLVPRPAIQTEPPALVAPARPAQRPARANQKS